MARTAPVTFPDFPDPFARMRSVEMAGTRVTRDPRWVPLPARRQFDVDVNVGTAASSSASSNATQPLATRHATSVQAKKGPGLRRGKYGQWERLGNDDRKPTVRDG